MSRLFYSLSAHLLHPLIARGSIALAAKAVLEGVDPSRQRGASDKVGEHAKIHPVVQKAMLPGKGLEGRSAETCADPEAVSDYLYEYEKKTGKKLTTGKKCHDDVAEALADMKFQATEEGAGNRAPCKNCSQMFANLMDKYGAPEPSNIGSGATSTDPTANTNFSIPDGGQIGFLEYPI